MSAAAGGPQRTCLGCRQVMDRSRLVRYVRAPDGAVLVDYRERLPGRGAYTCLKQECIAAAVRRRQFDRAFRVSCPLPAADELCRQLREELRGRVEALLGMARKAGQVLAGSNLVLDALDQPGRLHVVIVTGDVSPGVGEKILRKAAGRGVTALRFGDKPLLGRLLGRSEYSVAALVKGRLAETFLAEWQKYTELSGDN